MSAIQAVKTRVAGAVCLALLLASAAPARARVDEAAESARQHYHAGTKLFDLRRYREAAAEYEAAFEAKEDPALLFNIAQAYRLAGAYEDAVASYRSFLRHVPEAANREQVLARIKELQELAAAQRKQNELPPEGTLTTKEAKPETAGKGEHEVVVALPPAATRAPADSSRRGHRLKLAGIGVAAGGLALVAVGATFAVLALKTSDQVSAAKQDQLFDPALDAQGKTYQPLAIATLAVGGVALAGGTALWLWGRHEEKRGSLVLAPAATSRRSGGF
jgi:tetratricopeptide (TPR) repeat protein